MCLVVPVGSGPGSAVGRGRGLRAPAARYALLPSPAVLSAPLEFVWPDGRKRTTYHDIKWNESLNVLLAAGKDKLLDMYTLA